MEETSVAGVDGIRITAWDLWVPGGGLGMFVALLSFPGRRRIGYWAAVVGGPAAPFVVIADLDVPPPAGGLELRTVGLWADANLEEPGRRWSAGLEAFAVGVDDAAVYRDVDPSVVRGDRVPLGFDLEWEAADDPVTPGPERPSCVVRGELLVGAEAIELADLGATGTFTGPTIRTTAAGDTWWGVVEGRPVEGVGLAPDGAAVVAVVPLQIAAGVHLERRRWSLGSDGDGWSEGFVLSPPRG